MPYSYEVSVKLHIIIEKLHGLGDVSYQIVNDFSVSSKTGMTSG